MLGIIYALVVLYLIMFITAFTCSITFVVFGLMSYGNTIFWLAIIEICLFLLSIIVTTTIKHKRIKFYAETCITAISFAICIWAGVEFLSIDLDNLVNVKTHVFGICFLIFEVSAAVLWIITKTMKARAIAKLTLYFNEIEKNLSEKPELEKIMEEIWNPENS